MIINIDCSEVSALCQARDTLRERERERNSDRDNYAADNINH